MRRFRWLWAAPLFLFPALGRRRRPRNRVLHELVRRRRSTAGFIRRCQGIYRSTASRSQSGWGDRRSRTAIACWPQMDVFMDTTFRPWPRWSRAAGGDHRGHIPEGPRGDHLAVRRERVEDLKGKPIYISRRAQTSGRGWSLDTGLATDRSARTRSASSRFSRTGCLPAGLCHLRAVFHEQAG